MLYFNTLHRRCNPCSLSQHCTSAHYTVAAILAASTCVVLSTHLQSSLPQSALHTSKTLYTVAVILEVPTCVVLQHITPPLHSLQPQPALYFTTLHRRCNSRSPNLCCTLNTLHRHCIPCSPSQHCTSTHYTGAAILAASASIVLQHTTPALQSLQSQPVLYFNKSAILTAAISVAH